jgi:hypothetical protein
MARRQLQAHRGRQAEAAQQPLRVLLELGCEAVGYLLSGGDLDELCVAVTIR